MESDIKATEAAEKAAQEAGIDLASIEGTGADGKIVKDDVDAAAEAQEAPAADAEDSEADIAAADPAISDEQMADIDLDDPTAVDAARSNTYNEMASEKGWPVETEDGDLILIVDKKPGLAGTDILIAEDGTEYVSSPLGIVHNQVSAA